MALHVFVDESMRRDFLLCAVLVDSNGLVAARARLRDLRLPGQRRIHFVNEGPPRRRVLLAELKVLGLRARVYRSGSRPVSARRSCLRELMLDLADMPVARLVIESGDAENTRDRRVAHDLTAQIPWLKAASYVHLRAFEEPMLWAADAVAWAVGASAPWSDLVAPIVEKSFRIP